MILIILLLISLYKDDSIHAHRRSLFLTFVARGAKYIRDVWTLGQTSHKFTDFDQSTTMKVLLLTTLFVGAALSAAIPASDTVQAKTPPAPYSFAWAVKDGVSANDYNHRESSDGKTVRGSYKIQLSDGRIQTVNYKADSNGYVADVEYSDGQMNSNNQELLPAPAAIH